MVKCGAFHQGGVTQVPRVLGITKQNFNNMLSARDGGTLAGSAALWQDPGKSILKVRDVPFQQAHRASG